MAALRFFIPGRPVPKQSFRMGARPWQPKRVTDYAHRVRCVAAAAAHRARWVVPGPDVPLAVTLRLGYALPKSTRKADRGKTSLRLTTPDVDNATKAVLDPCDGLWTDDRQVAVLRCVKFNVPRGQEGVTVTVETLDNDEVRSIIMDEFPEGSGS